VEATAARYTAAQPIDLDPQQRQDGPRQLQGTGEPALARELWTQDATDPLRKVEILALVLIGRKGVQIDAVTDGQPLEQAAADNHNVTFAYPANANQVFKEDTRLSAEVAAAPGNGYNADGTHLDPEALDTTLGWLRRVLT
jgi:hypothetical protein